MRLSKVSMVHRVQQEARAIIQLCISAMKMGDCIALGRTQLLLYLVNCVMNRALKLVSLPVRHLIFCHRVIRFNCLFTKALVHSKERSVFASMSSFPLGLSVFLLRPSPPPKPLYLTFLPFSNTHACRYRMTEMGNVMTTVVFTVSTYSAPNATWATNKPSTFPDTVCERGWEMYPGKL